MIPARILMVSILSLLPLPALAQGTVLLVIGSDTGIWDGLDVSTYRCTIGPTLYTDPTRNANRVMDPAFRDSLVDYYGTPMKLTWWMMAGNMFRLSVNTDVPTPSTMPIYLMNRYEGDGLRQWGDEMSFHYHDWYWSDENGDGIWYWNQAPAFPVIAAEFDQTLAEMLIEEDLFPVSFRSGWHAMDNAWQHRLDEILPFSMHNDYPSVHSDPTEPVDNVYDWSRAPSSFIPFHPSTTDYQVPGDGRGWNLRSRYMSAADSAFLTGIFAAASTGVDQVVCLWAHLPETDFLDNLQKVHRSALAASSTYPSVPYRYCTAVEAMQRWLGTSDTTKPTITLTEQTSGEEIGWTVEVDEPIFQIVPVVAVKDRYALHRLLPMTQTAPYRWETTVRVLQSDLAAVAVAVTDTSGNLSTLHQRYLPEDIYIDDGDPGYQELAGVWSTIPLRGWGASFRSASVSAADSASARWSARVLQPGTYSVFLREPATSQPAENVRITVTGGSTSVDSVFTRSALVGDQWTYLTTTDLDPAIPIVVEVISRATGPQVLTADVLRLTPLVKNKWVTGPDLVDVGDFIVDSEQPGEVLFHNSGVASASILTARLASGRTVEGAFPRSVPAMGSTAVHFTVRADSAGSFLDTLIVTTDDARHPEIRTLLIGRIREYFVVVDDLDSLSYSETGTWAFSVAAAYRSTSRYAYPGANVSATFSTRLEKAGTYEISEIVPKTVNASDRSKYVLRLSGLPMDSVYLDQNQGSGGWVYLMSASLSDATEVSVTVTDAMSPVLPERVLRADALQFQWVGATGPTAVAPPSLLPESTRLLQNYPNPFNPETAIRYQLSTVSHVDLRIFDLVGREVSVLVDGEQLPGRYEVSFNASAMSSGVYISRFSAAGVVQIRKMILIR
jgi:hypothetical protein